MLTAQADVIQKMVVEYKQPEPEQQTSLSHYLPRLTTYMWNTGF